MKDCQGMRHKLVCILP